MLCLLAAPALVTVSFAPLRLPEALAKLSAAAGETLTCSPALKDRVLLARLKDADEARVLREIATCFDARWEATSKGRILKPDSNIEIRRQAEARSARLQLAVTTQSKYRQQMADVKGKLASVVDAYLKRVNQPSAKDDDNPSMAFSIYTLTRLFLGLSASELAALKPGERIVWAERPTTMQRPMPGFLQKPLDFYRRMMGKLGGPVAIRIRIALETTETGWSFTFAALDGRGFDVDKGWASMESDSAEASEPVTIALAKSEIPLPEEVADYLSVVEYRRRPIRNSAYERWRPRLADPVAFEPMQWYPGALMVAGAEANGRNLIGTVPEYTDGKLIDDPIDRPFALKTFNRLWTLRDGWLIAKLSEPIASVSREEARTFIADTERQGGLSVDRAAEWLAAHPGSMPDISWLSTRLALLVSGHGGVGSDMTFLDEQPLVIWSRLGRSAQNSLRNGAVLPIGALPQSAQDLLCREVFGTGSAVEPNRAENDLHVAEGEEVADVDITDRLPNGLEGGIVTLQITEEPVAVAWTAASGDPVNHVPRTALDMGTRLGTSDRKLESPTYDRFLMGTTRRYDLVLRFPKARLSYPYILRETFIDPKAPVIDHLPADFQAQVDAARKKAREAKPESD